ncbi:hypothetical protein FMGBMHLM_4388 [Methylobacterium aerolatum]|nr:hypothetical protein FMGBMHLM_4388 [Methylobacterium aerolatum]
MEQPSQSHSWTRFVRDVLVTGLGLGLAVIAFVALADPYGLRAAPGYPPGPLVDTDQRWSYPQVARSGVFTSAVFGSSTSRLLDPQALDAALGSRFANLAMNGATPDEQLRLAALFLAARTPDTVIFGLDATWCDANPAPRGAIAFPDWLYEPHPTFGAFRQVNLRSLESAWKAAALHLGRGRAAIRPDGFAVFTPPETAYDPARARAHIAAGAPARDAHADPTDAPMPALDRLEALIAGLHGQTRTILAFMPVHARAQGRPGTPAGAREAACKGRAAAIGRDNGALVVDFRFPSAVTTEDTNYWDALHYRLPVAARIVESLKEVKDNGSDPGSAIVRVLAP